MEDIEAVVASFKVLSQSVPDRTEENHEERVRIASPSIKTGTRDRTNMNPFCLSRCSLSIPSIKLK